MVKDSCLGFSTLCLFSLGLGEGQVWGSCRKVGIGSFRLFLFHLSLQQMLLEGEGGETGPRPASETPKPLCLTQQGGGGHPCTAQLSLEGGSLRQASGGGPLPGTHPHWEMRSGYELWLGVGRQRWCSRPGVKHTFTHTLTCLPTRHMLIHTRTFTGVSTHAHTITHTCARTGTCSHMDIHTCTRGCTAPQAHTDTRMHARSRL